MIKNNLWIIILYLWCSNPLFAQQKDSIEKVNYSIKQIDASYKGGLGAMVLFIDQHIQLSSVKKGISKTVLLNTHFDSEGNITEVTILSGINKSIDQAIIDVIKQMPAWNPATINGIPIPSKQVIGYNISY